MAVPQFKAVLIATPQMRSESGLTFRSKQSAVWPADPRGRRGGREPAGRTCYFAQIPHNVRFSHHCYSVLLPIHELGEILRIVSFGALEGEVHFAWRSKSITQFVAFAKQVCVGYSRLCEEINECHAFSITSVVSGYSAIRTFRPGSPKLLDCRQTIQNRASAPGEHNSPQGLPNLREPNCRRLPPENIRRFVSISLVMHQRTPKYLFGLYEGFHLALVLRHADHRYVMHLDRL
jgi:hypothetical protein